MRALLDVNVLRHRGQFAPPIGATQNSLSDSSKKLRAVP